MGGNKLRKFVNRYYYWSTLKTEIYNLEPIQSSQMKQKVKEASQNRKEIQNWSLPKSFLNLERIDRYFYYCT